MTDNGASDTRELLRGQLQRERRILLAVSFVLLAHQILGIEVNNSAESLGLRFDVANPARLWVGVWVIWGWAIIRYAQLLYSFRPGEEFPRNRYFLTLHAICDWIIVRRVHREAKAVFQDVPRVSRIGLSILKLGRWDPIVTPTSRYARVKSRNPGVAITWLQLNIVRTLRYDPSQPRPKLAQIGEEPRTRDDICDWERTGGSESIQENEGKHAVTDSIEVPLSIEWSWWPRVAARTWAVVMTSYGTEHYVPLVIGLAPLAAGFFGLPAEPAPMPLDSILY
jgi:hypothetical protein